MKKITALLLLLVALCSFVGCEKSVEANPSLELKEVVLSDVREAMIHEIGAAEPFLLETEALMNLYGIDSQWVASSAGFVTMNGTFPDEIILVEAVDEASAEEVRGKLENRLAEVLVQSKTYDAENYAAAQACTVRVDGVYVCLILSPEQERLSEIYQKNLFEE